MKAKGHEEEFSLMYSKYKVFHNEYWAALEEDMILITGVKGDAGWQCFVAIEWGIHSTGSGFAT